MFPVRFGVRLAQQIRGNGSPTSMSTIRLPPRAVSRRTKSRRFRLNLADDRGVDAKRMAAETRQCIVRRPRARRRRRASPRWRRRADRSRGSRPRPATSGRTGIAGSSSLTARRWWRRARSAPSPGRRGSGRASSAAAGRARRARSVERVQRRGVALERGLELQVAAGDEDGEAVVADRARRRGRGRQAVGAPNGSHACARRRRW